MKASFVIGFHTARIENLNQTLRFLKKQRVIQECELVLVCQDTCTELICPSKELRGEGWASKQHFNMEVECMQLPVLTNFGVEKASCDKIIVLESDRILPKGYFAEVIDQLEEGIQITTKDMIKFTKHFTDEEIQTGQWKSGLWNPSRPDEADVDYKEEHRSNTNEIGLRNMWSGNTAFMKSDFEKAGRMDESYKGYGWADSDMTYAMEAVGVKSVYRYELEFHLWHPPATYGEGDQKQMFIDNGIRFCNKWDKDKPDWFLKEIRDHRAMRMI
jgi:hypothetical protein